MLHAYFILKCIKYVNNSQILNVVFFSMLFLKLYTCMSLSYYNDL